MSANRKTTVIASDKIVRSRWPRAFISRIVGRSRIAVAGASILLLIGCSSQADTAKQPAKPPEPKNQTYSTIGGEGVISLISSDELEIREGGENIVCKYTKQEGRLRVVVTARGTTTAKYYNMTPQSLVDEDGQIYYELATREMMMGQREADIDIYNIGDALRSYNMEQGKYPSKLEDLTNGSASYFQKGVPKDPWGRAYQYACPGSHRPLTFDLYSLGADGVPSTDDVVNWSKDQ